MCHITTCIWPLFLRFVNTIPYLTLPYHTKCKQGEEERLVLDDRMLAHLQQEFDRVGYQPFVHINSLDVC
jgi:hypothetical protein